MALTWASDSATGAATDLTAGSDDEYDDLPDEWLPLSLETEFSGMRNSGVLHSAWRWLLENRTPVHRGAESDAMGHALVDLKGWNPTRLGKGFTALHHLPQDQGPVPLTFATELTNAPGRFKVTLTVNPRSDGANEAFRAGSTAQILAHEYSVHGLPFLRSIVECRANGTAVIEDEPTQHDRLRAGNVADYEYFRNQVANSADDFYNGFAERHNRESPGRTMALRT